jgi:hypothetical protein
MLAVLQIVVGIVFILLLLSLLGTTLMELISGLLALRGKHLFKSLQNMLGDKFYDFVSHPFYSQLIEDAQKDQLLTRRALPSYISPAAFRSIFMDILRNQSAEQTHIAHHIENLKDGELKHLLRFLLRDAKGDQFMFENRVDQWFVQVMDRVSGWYKRTTRYWLLGVGFFIAVLFNADTIQIYQALSSDAQLRNQAASSANLFIQENGQLRPMTHTATPTVPGSAIIQPSVPTAQQQPMRLNGEQISQLTSPLGLGWANTNIDSLNIFQVLEKILGWFTTALAISLGAGFWFDALRRLVNINSTPSAVVSSSAKPSPKEDEGDG